MFQSIPGWWIWFYYICPVAWTLRGVICSQLGDVETIIVGPGFEGTVKKYLEVTFGYGPNMIGASIAALVGFCLLFFIVFALSVKFLNFQKRWASDLLSRDDRCFCRLHKNASKSKQKTIYGTIWYEDSLQCQISPDYLAWEFCGIFSRIFFLSHYAMSKQLCTSSTITLSPYFSSMLRAGI